LSLLIGTVLKQLIWLLKDYYGLSIKNRDDEDSTAEAILRQNSHPVCQKLCDYRETEKLVSTCIPALTENLSPDQFVHTHYHIGGTRTGRLSSSNPNLQQIPRGRIRSFIQSSSESRTLVTIDYSQIEVRLIAEAAKEEELIHAFKEGIDPYSVIAQKLLKVDCPVREIKERFKKERDVAKTAGLSILYGTGAAKLQEVLNKELNKNYKLAECKAFIEDYRKSLPAVSQFKIRLERDLANQKVYYNMLGRPFIIEDNDSLYMKSLNTLIQGSASDLVIHSALKVKKALDALSVPNNCCMLIHDEQVWQLPSDEAELLTQEVIIPAMTTEIEKELGFVVPLKVEYAINKEWAKP
jgi:DNA polymerase-1